MKIYRFDQEVGKPINAYGSKFVMARIGHYLGEFQLGCMHLDEQGLVGEHEAATDQLFLVIDGQGWVSGDTGDRTHIKAGQAAFWEKGEMHAAGTGGHTMKAIVIEGEKLNPDKFMAK